MNRISGLIVKLISGVIVLYLLIHTLSPGGPLGNLTGMLITKYPFHQGLLDVFASSLGWDISFVPVVQSSLLDDIACEDAFAYALAAASANCLSMKCGEFELETAFDR